MIINLIADDSVASAPPGFVATIQAAAAIMEQTFTNNITINIRFGWGSFNDTEMSNLQGATGAEAMYTSATLQSYATVKQWLTAAATSKADQSAVASLPASSSALPNPSGFVAVTSAELKALGHYSGPDTLDGAIGFGTASTSDFWLGAAMHEIAHAMGRVSGYSLPNYEDLLDLFRYSGAGTYQWVGGQPAYFSVDGGVTDLANFSTVSDYADLANDSLTPNDPFDAFVTATFLTPVDRTIMDTMGFAVRNPTVLSGGQSQTVSRATLNHAVAFAGGMLTVADGGTTADTIVASGGIESIGSGGRALRTVISSGGQQTVLGLSFRGTILDGGSEVVSGGGSTISAQVDGTLDVLSDGTAQATVILADGGLAVGGGGQSFGASITSGATMTVSGGAAGGTNVASGGSLDIVSGGGVSNTTVLNGGLATALSGGTLGSTHVLSGGELVYAGGAVSGTRFDSGAKEAIVSGVTVSRVTAANGVTLTVSSGATADIVLLSGGTAIAGAGATIDQRVRFVTGNSEMTIASTTHFSAGIYGFGNSDTLDLSDFAFSGAEKLTFVEGANNVWGTLVVTDGALRFKVTLFGQYTAAGFHLAGDGAGGTAIRYNAPVGAMPDIAGTATT